MNDNPSDNNSTLDKLPLAGLSAVLCGLFGVALILNVQLAGDGCWYWYAQEFLSGSRLHADLGLAQQPLYILLNALTIKLFGVSWIASRLLALAGLLLLVIPIHLLVRRTGLRNWEQGILVAATFFVGIHFEAYRFDDYHVIVDGLCLWAAWLLLDLRQTTSSRGQIVRAAALGAACGLALVTRLNDGGLLLATALPLVLLLATGRRFMLAGIALLTSLLVAAAVILVSGDSLSDWFQFSVVKAASAKGTGGSLFITPLLLPWRAAQVAFSEAGLSALVPLTLLASAFAAWVAARRLAVRWRAAARIAVVLLIVYLLFLLPYADLIVSASALCVWIACALLAVLLFRSVGALARRSPQSLTGDARFILLIPIGLWISGSLSTGGWHYGLYFPFALFVLLCMISPPRFLVAAEARAALCALLALLAAAGVSYRIENPCSWHSYRVPPLFRNRAVVNHPLYGRMVIDADLHALITPLCAPVTAQGGELLSLPFPYPNYYTGIRPWNGYVQTFFDTSTARTIEKLTAELQQSPPRWIIYQRQLKNLALHEEVFHAGRPLPHRALDTLLMNKIDSGEWAVVARRELPPDNTWMLIRTRQGAVP